MKSQSRLNQTVGVPATASSQLGSGALLFNRRALKSLHIHIHSHIIKTYFKNRESFHQKPQMAGDLAEDFKLHTEYARQMGSWRSSIHNEVQKCDNDFGPLGFHSHGLKAGARNMWKQMEIRIQKKKKSFQRARKKTGSTHVSYEPDSHAASSATSFRHMTLTLQVMTCLSQEN